MSEIKENNICLLEGINSVSAVIKAKRAGVCRREIKRVLVAESKKKSEFRRVAFLKAAAEELGFPLEFAPDEAVSSIASGRTHGGILAEVTSQNFPGLDVLTPGGTGFAVLLEGAEDPYSLGHAMRSLYSCGASELILPARYPDGADATLARASAGCSELLPVYVCEPCEAVKKYKAAGYRICAAEIKDAYDAPSAPLEFPLLLLIGGEKRGLSAALKELTDINIKIPYRRDFMGSLPTETATAMLAYELMRRTGDTLQ